MTKFLLFIIMFWGTNKAFCQTSNIPRHPTVREQRIAFKNDQCGKRHSFSLSQRLQNYPFNEAATVVLISFKDTSVLQSRIPVENKKIIDKTIIEKVILSPSQVDSLTDLFYNIGPKPNNFWYKEPHPGRSCYNPHNGIVFLDREERVLEYIEICFDCQIMEFSSEKINLGDFCDQKDILLQQYFKTVGVKYVTAINSD